MSEKSRTLPILVNRRGKQRTIEVRRDANEIVMQQTLNSRGVIRLRVVIQIEDGHGNYLGYQGESSRTEVNSVKDARLFAKRLREFVEG